MASLLDNDRIIQATAVGAEPQFAYDFPIKAAADLVVKRRVVDVITTLVLSVDYTVTGVGDVGGGQVVLDVGVFPTGATAGDEFTIFGDQVVERATASDFAKGGDFFAATINAQLDDLTRISQDLKRDTNQSLRKDPAITETLDPLIKTLVDKKGLKLVEGSPGVFTLSLTDSDIDTAAAAAAVSAAAALVSETAAAASEVAAQSSEDDAQISEDAAAVSETNAAASADLAATNAASGLYKNVFDIAFSDSPFTVLSTQDGFLIQVDTSGGNVVVNLVDSTSLTADFRMAVAKMTADANTVTVQRQGTDTVNGVTNQVITDQFETVNFILDQSQGQYLATGQAATLLGGNGIDLTGGTISIDLGTDPGLVLTAAKLLVLLNGGTILKGASGLSVDVGTSANKIVQLDGSAKLPAVDGSQLTNLPGGWVEVATVSLLSGSSNTFASSLPSGIKAMQVIFQDINLDGSGNLELQLGDSGGLETTGYESLCITIVTTTPTVVNSVDGVEIQRVGTGDTVSGIMHISRVDTGATDAWIFSGAFEGAASTGHAIGGRKLLSAQLTQIAILATGGSFTAGKISLKFHL